MVDDMKTPLFKTIEKEIIVETNNYNEDEEMCREVSLNNILDGSLIGVALLTSKHKTTIMVKLYGISRKTLDLQQKTYQNKYLLSQKLVILNYIKKNSYKLVFVVQSQFLLKPRV